ncbi:hypothetical protein TI05_12975 [Achromatium sp. WMS3]|nr:hypothetical protein TI05_12975 [Achromatium sp. WMS3]
MAEVFPITIRKFLLLWVGCITLVLMTYNPFGLSFYHWITGPSKDFFSLKLLAGVFIFSTYMVLGWIIGSQLRRVGVATGILLLALLVNEVLAELEGASPILKRFAVVLCIGTVLAVGLAWPHFEVNMSGIINKRYLIPKIKYRKYWHWWHWR